MPIVDRSTVSLRFFGKNLVPDRLSELLQCQPSSAARTGQVLTSASGTQRKVPRGFWFLQYGDADAVDLEIKIRQLLDKTTDNLSVWSELTSDYRADLFCGLFLDGWNRAMGLSAGLMKDLGYRNLTLELDIYSPVDSWSDNPDNDEE